MTILGATILGAVLLGTGYILASQSSSFWQFVAIQAVLIGMLGGSVTFGPLVADVSFWFRRRRGIAVAIAASIWLPMRDPLLFTIYWLIVLAIIFWILLLAVADMIAAVPRPSALSRTMRHRQTCFCGEEGCVITASSRARSSAETVKNIPVRIPLNRIGQSKWESQIGLLCYAQSTRDAARDCPILPVPLSRDSRYLWPVVASGYDISRAGLCASDDVVHCADQDSTKPEFHPESPGASGGAGNGSHPDPKRGCHANS